jgi:hypothetical protein
MGSLDGRLRKRAERRWKEMNKSIRPPSKGRMDLFIKERLKWLS